MKEAIGGTWIFGIVIVFIALFTAFVSLSTNYSRCYRIKDELINTIERYHGINEDSISRINEYLSGIGYASTGECPQDGTCWYQFSADINSTKPVNGYGGSSKTNYCISKYDVVSKDAKGNLLGPIGHIENSYYQVVVFFKLDIPIFRQLFNIKIAGETATIYMPNDMIEVVNGNCKVM